MIPPGVGLDIQLVMSDRTLFDGDNEPAILTGYGPIPAVLARRLVRRRHRRSSRGSAGCTPILGPGS